MRNIAILLALATTSLFANESGSFKHKHKDFYSYAGVGCSAFVIVPYGVNFSLGTRMAKPNSPIGIDVSGNITSTFATQYYFGKLLIPLYFSSETVTNSYFCGPFATFGLNNQFQRISYNLRKGTSLLAVTGVTFGKNIAQDGKLSFWQASANINRFDIKSEKTKQNPWPTVTFQYGIGF